MTSWNAGAQRIKGYAPRRDRRQALLPLLSPTRTSRPASPGRSSPPRARDGRAEDEGWRVRKDGARFWARVVVTPLHDADGHLRGFAKVTQDLTDRRHIQSLEDAAQAINEFIAMLAHELRNPLAPIRNAVEVMAKVPARDPAQQAMRDDDRPAERAARAHRRRHDRHRARHARSDEHRAGPGGPGRGGAPRRRDRGRRPSKPAGTGSTSSCRKSR